MPGWVESIQANSAGLMYLEQRKEDRRTRRCTRTAARRCGSTGTGDPYQTAVLGSFRLLPDSARLDELEPDYREMREMFFEEPPAWPVLVERLRRLEDEINGKTGAGGDGDRKAEG
jgi:hypothetical protein